jgi:hypothetical protein
MHLPFRSLFASLSLVALLSTPLSTYAVGNGNALSDEALWYGPELQATADGSVHLAINLPGVTVRSFQDYDSGKPQLLDATIQPNNGRYIYLSVRLDQALPSYSDSTASIGPFITKLYRYDLSTRRLTRIYREDSGSGYIQLGFDGSKLLLYPAIYGDNSPGPCWLEEIMADGTGLQYIDTNRPAQGLKHYVPSKKFKAAKQKALATCQQDVFGEPL